MTDIQTDQVYYILDAHWHREYSPKILAGVLKQQPNPYTVTDGQINYGVASILKMRTFLDQRNFVI